MHGWELDDILRERNLTLKPGDAVIVYSGRDAWQAQDPTRPYSKADGPASSIGRVSTSHACRFSEIMT